MNVEMKHESKKSRSEQKKEHPVTFLFGQYWGGEEGKKREQRHGCMVQKGLRGERGRSGEKKQR